jgi:hypothetical protein
MKQTPSGRRVFSALGPAFQSDNNAEQILTAETEPIPKATRHALHRLGRRHRCTVWKFRHPIPPLSANEDIDVLIQQEHDENPFQGNGYRSFQATSLPPNMRHQLLVLTLVVAYASQPTQVSSFMRHMALSRLHAQFRPDYSLYVKKSPSKGVKSDVFTVNGDSASFWLPPKNGYSSSFGDFSDFVGTTALQNAAWLGRRTSSTKDRGTLEEQEYERDLLQFNRLRYGFTDDHDNDFQERYDGDERYIFNGFRISGDESKSRIEDDSVPLKHQPLPASSQIDTRDSVQQRRSSQRLGQPWRSDQRQRIRGRRNRENLGNAAVTTTSPAPKERQVTMALKTLEQDSK